MRIGVVATYPPTLCGIAAFAKHLTDAIESSTESECVVVRSVPTRDTSQHPRVQEHLVAGDRDSQVAAVRVLNSCDVAIIEHEFGIYGGADGAEILPVAKGVRQPLIVTLHTVLAAPSRRQLAIIEHLARAADAVVVMTHAAQVLASRVYHVPPEKILVIPHGSTFTPQAPARMVPNRLVTWGLLGPGKGIEWAIRALPALADLRPDLRYHVIGDIHPTVRRSSGTAYRMLLEREAERLGVTENLVLDPGYHADRSLLRLIATASVVVLPYESTDQATSGVLVDALAAGRPVVATCFPHATEALGGGAGLVVPHQDPDALAAAIRELLTTPGALAAASLASARVGRHLSWSAVVGAYRDVARRLVHRRRRITRGRANP
ncbi:glycosyltransferase [Propionicimonas sp.]|uniref:glycosyltransferase n=1 Tax=Propionicimonas sp. TaxID=1955623 RepID=UPI0039E425AB